MLKIFGCIGSGYYVAPYRGAQNRIGPLYARVADARAALKAATK